jgi:glyoxylase-like metal-dependent hydrolase (beta-lactamase superfamily II)
VIATAVLHGSGGVALVDPGPSTTLPRSAPRWERPGSPCRTSLALLLTHIHLDHAGATGTLLRENPRLRVACTKKGRRT